MRFIQAVLDFLRGSDPAWHLESLKYIERDRHRHSIDPMYYDHLKLVETRSTADNVKERTLPTFSTQQRRQYHAYRFRNSNHSVLAGLYAVKATGTDGKAKTGNSDRTDHARLRSGKNLERYSLRVEADC